MKKSQLIAITTLATTAVVAAGVTIFLRRKKNHQKRLIAVSNAGYEMAYDIHYPIKYKTAK